MSFISIMGIIGLFVGTIQILIPDYLLRVGFQGVKTREQIKYGGFGTVLMGILFIIFDFLN